MANEKHNEIVPYKDDRFIKSNFLISATYKSTLIENKLLAIGLSKVQKLDGKLVSIMRASELQNLMCNGKKSGSFYGQLYDVANAMTDRKVIMQDEDEFDIFVLMPRARYSQGTFTIYWNDELEKHLHQIKKNYTVLNLPIILDFRSIYSLRLYELLKSKAYYPKGEERNENVFKIMLSVAELKLDMGVVDSNSEKVQKILIPRGRQKGAPDYEKAVEVAENKKMYVWQDFKRSVLMVAIKEINEKTDLEVDFTPVKSGRGGKVTDVNFVIKIKGFEKIKIETEKISQVEKDEVLEQIIEITGVNLKIKDARAIAEAAEYDVEKVKKAYRIMSSTSGNISNVVGFMISAIKNDFSESIKELAAGKERNRFNNFPQREYTKEEYSDMERKLLGLNQSYQTSLFDEE